MADCNYTPSDFSCIYYLVIVELSEGTGKNKKTIRSVDDLLCI